MTRRERLMRTLRGEPVDRPPVNFYEISGMEDPSPADPFNIYSHPSWQPVIEMARDRSDRIVLTNLPFRAAAHQPAAWQAMPELAAQTERATAADGSELTTSTLRVGGRTLTQRTRRDRDVYTVWTVEHLLKDTDDFRAWLELPEAAVQGTADPQPVLDREALLGDSGIVLLDTPDPLCMVAPLFSMEDFTIIALTEPDLFHRALERSARELYPKIEAVARALPGRLWRIYGPEYASEPYLPPARFEEYVVKYVKPMVTLIQSHGGFARIHCHGRLRNILDLIVATGCVGLDPVEPPPQGDIDLAGVRERYGRDLVLFGNLEASDLENLTADEFDVKIRQALREGMVGTGRGFVLMPSASPYGRVLSPRAVANYARMLAAVGA